MYKGLNIKTITYDYSSVDRNKIKKKETILTGITNRIKINNNKIMSHSALEIKGFLIFILFRQLIKV